MTYANKKKYYGEKSIPAAKLWLESEDRREYEGVVFEPGRNISGYYNLWRGFAVEPEEGDWSLLQEHIYRVIAGGNEEQFNYIISWMARIAQNPGGERPGTSIVLRGRQGTGKGIFVSNFGKLFGSHFLHITNQNQVTGRFNAHLKDALVVYVDEGFWAGDKSAEGVLKGMVTEELHMIEPKGKDAFAVRNYINLIIASNNLHVVPAGLEERRFVVEDVSEERIRDFNYFHAIAHQMENGGREALLYDLLHHDISGINLRDIPRTEALLDQIINSMNSVEKFWFNRLVEGDVPEVVQTNYFYDSYRVFCRDQNIRYKLIPQQFGKEIHKLCPGIEKVRRSAAFGRNYYYAFPDLEECRDQFEAAVNMIIDWGDFEVDEMTDENGEDGGEQVPSVFEVLAGS
jgi:phage/plasmid-associated DNA primase